jgi:N-acyl-phosphatidylethanolamine-hydrolysing phospholipase D
MPEATRDPSAALMTLTAHHAPDGSFRNPWPDSVPHGFADVLRWMRDRRTTPRAPTPRRGWLPTAQPQLVYPHAPPDMATATWVGHSTVLLQAGGLNVLTDPMWSERAFPVQWAGPRRVMPPAVALEALPPLDIVLLSHNHYDHLDRQTVRQLARQHPGITWVVPLALGRYVRGFGARDVVELDWDQVAQVRGTTIRATPARHFSARRLRDRNRTLWCGFVLECGGRRFYFAGDTAYHPEFAAIGAHGPLDLVMMPIGAYDPRWFMRIVHVDPEEAVRAYTDLTSAHPDSPLPLMLGIHWGTFRLTDEPMDEPPRRARACWHGAGLPDERLWIAQVGETRTLR